MGQVNSCCNNPVAKNLPIAGAVVCFTGAALAASVALFVLSHLATGYLYTATGLTVGVSKTALSTILMISKWSAVAAAGGIGLGTLSLMIWGVQMKCADSKDTHKYQEVQN